MLWVCMTTLSYTPKPLILVLRRHMLRLLLLISAVSSQHLDVLTTDQAESRLRWISATERLQRKNCREISFEESVHQIVKVKWRKRWRSSKGRRRWLCPGKDSKQF